MENEAVQNAPDNVLHGTSIEPREVPQIQSPDAAPLPEADVDYQRTSSVNLSPTVSVDREEDLQEPSQISDWYYADGVAGKGDKPEWFNDKTFKTIEEQARAQNEARKRLGGFVGAPEEGYELNLEEDLADLGLNEDDGILNQIADSAQELNMSQEGFNQLLNVYGTGMQEAMQQVEEENQQEYEAELTKLGPNGKEELKLIKQWSQNNIAPEMQQEFYGMLTSADRVKIFINLMDKIVPTRLSHIPPGTGLSRSHLMDMMKDPRYLNDADYQRHVDAEAENLYGVSKF